jgi:cytochrome c oxidase cbb3-type subunit 3
VSQSVSLWIISMVLLNIILVLASLWWMRRQSTDSSASEATTGHVWDDDLVELNNPLPRWWLWLFLLSIVFAAAYLVVYPGFGSFRGTLGWTQLTQHQQQQATQERTAQAILARFRGRSIAELSRDPAALSIGRNLFANECSLCHGSDARGAASFPNLTDADWLWGGQPERVIQTINEGRVAAMPGWGPALGSKGVEDMLAYVLSLSGRSVAVGDVAAGGKQYAALCASCHGADAKGNQELGAPNLADNVWLHGGRVETVRNIIANGVQNNMPAQGQRLGALRVNLLTAYVASLSEVHGTGPQP